MTTSTPIVAIALDAAEASVVDQLCQAGKLPVLARLREQGRSGVIQSEAEYFLSTVWPTLATGKNTEHHGWYYNKMWRPDKMRLQYASEEWLDQAPFWEWPGTDGLEMAVIDVPYVLRPPKPFEGIFLAGWQTHDDFGFLSSPADLRRRLVGRFGRPVLKTERFGEQTAKTLLRFRREMLDSLSQTAEMAHSLLAERTRDLFMLVIGALHRGTHYLWDLEQIDRSGVSADEIAVLEGARDELFVAADRCIGRILEAAPDNARVVVFALHGMTANSGWADRFPSLVSQIRNHGSPRPPQEGFLYRCKRRIPWRVIRQVTTRLPTSVNQALVPLWSARMLDWSDTRFFALPLDINGYVRINLRGREARGIVEPGSEYAELLAELEQAFCSFKTIDTGEPVVRDVARTDDLVDPAAPRRHLLPDLIVRFHPIRSQEVSGVTSEEYGEVRWTPEDPLPSGRSGNHLPTGWFTAAGGGIQPGPELRINSLDIVPTFFHWLGAEVPETIHGRPIAGLGAGSAATSIR
jgi:predicted AlkP superfamily phosphohydrolase/phosphomutase